jgi:ABC-type transport system involved in Fe-S cluster assembly fused permease/ATPase subunit
VFQHLHSLSLRFHLERQTGGMTRDIERGTRGMHSLISMSLYSIVPTIIELVLVLTILGVKFDAVRLDHRHRRWCCTSASRSR